MSSKYVNKTNNNLIQIIKDLESERIKKNNFIKVKLADIKSLKSENEKLKKYMNDINYKINSLIYENEKLKKDNKILRENILEKNNKINDYEILIKKQAKDISLLKVIEKDLKSLLNMNNIKINEYINTIKEYNEKFENKIDEESIKFYGFINSGNNCYLNSSLQLLTRINELKNGILNYQDNEINKDNNTKGQLFVEFKNIISEIENPQNDNLLINPEKLKYIMGNINQIYYRSSLEDSNEFISNFISGLFNETANKAKVKNIKILDINNKMDKKAYDKFCNRFYLNKGYSFLIDIFYGIFKSINYCKACKQTITIKFNAYNMLELPIYKLAKINNNKTLDLKEILNEFRREKQLKYECDNCKNTNELYTKLFLYTLPKYLILSFIRNVDGEYFYNNIEYDETLDIKNDYDNKTYNYSLECVIEHSGGVYSGHYTALCKDKKSNKWYRFNDIYCDKYNYNFHSKNALLLLYKSSD